MLCRSLPSDHNPDSTVHFSFMKWVVCVLVIAELEMI